MKNNTDMNKMRYQKVFLDQESRIVLPEGILKESGLMPNDSLEILTSKNNILLKIIKDSCVLCGSRENILEYKGKKVCRSCVDKLKDFYNNMFC